MERAKTFFGNRDHEGYVGKDEHSVSLIRKMIFIPVKLQTADKQRPHTLQY